MRKRLTILLAFVLFSSFIFAQTAQTILLMTGKEIEGNVTGQDTIYLYYDLVKSSGKTKAKKLDLERVFSINGPEGEEKVIYYMNTVVGNYFTVDEMRFYIQGEQDASKYYRANWTIAAGLPVTAGLGYVLSGTVFSFAVPFVYLVATGIPAYKIDKEKIPSSHLITEPAYVLGYERTVRNKRLFKSLFTGLVGTAIGFTLGQDLIK